MRRLAPFVPALILFTGCVLLLRTRVQGAVPLAAPLRTILAVEPGYSVVDQTLTAEERQVAGMTDYIARAYVRDSVVAFTTLVSYYDRQTQGKTIHSPRNCLPGAGWEIMSGGGRSLMVDGIARPVNRYVLRNGSALALAYYWYQGRGRVVSDEYLVKWNLLRDAALRGHTEEALVRVVVPVRSQSATDQDRQRALAEADALAGEIASRLLRAVNAALPKPNSPAS